ncbi:MAG: DUF1512 family protein [Candidatus Undinarchaeales archaeon]
MNLFGMFGGDGGTRTILQWVFFIVIFMFVLPKLYFYQIFAKIDAAAKRLEKLSKEGQDDVVDATKKFGKNKKEIEANVKKFVDFFMVQPVNLDPNGILKKLEHTIDNTEDRFIEMSETIAPKANSEEKMNVFMGLQASVVVHTIAKIVRHYVEMAKKFKNMQFAMLMQMQLPIIEELAKSEKKGMEAFLKGHAIGDGIGPLIIAGFLDEDGKEIAKDVLAKTEKKWGRKVTFVKAKGPGGRLGKLGDAIKKLCKKKIVKIITVDASAKLEGEDTGKVAEGTGVAMGGIGVQRAKIEDIATKNDIPLDAIAVKMSQFEAIYPMKKEIADAAADAKELVKERVKTVPKGKHVIIVGVGNTCGVPNSNKKLKDVVKKIKKRAKKLKKEKEEKKKGWSIFKKTGTANNSMMLRFYKMVQSMTGGI